MPLLEAGATTGVGAITGAIEDGEIEDVDGDVDLADVLPPESDFLTPPSLSNSLLKPSN